MCFVAWVREIEGGAIIGPLRYQTACLLVFAVCWPQLLQISVCFGRLSSGFPLFVVCIGPRVSFSLQAFPPLTHLKGVHRLGMERVCLSSCTMKWLYVWADFTVVESCFLVTVGGETRPICRSLSGLWWVTKSFDFAFYPASFLSWRTRVLGLHNMVWP
ncbi:hypothetical protein TGPRC2_231450 [Toxoplasma gondii TgCatPRC2]|uniref:Uncharacterized protein n=1 Tax=Toxoplasma gondii TgCatPRC2 TaxID=1130821 RepID=A0A151H367_TOXGO|nr:hypothetical protein TGPRC2_231450 [Toxoplasma gondii TgCatPRC2]